MSVTKTQTDLMTGLYSLARRYGFLNTRVGRSMFSASYFFHKRHWEDPLAGLIKRRPELFSGGAILDIGANIGYTAALLAKAVDPAEKVYAFEPESENFSFLQELAAHSRLKGKIVPVQAAVGADDTSIELWLNDAHHGDHRIATDYFKRSNADLRVLTVPMVRVDTFCRQQGIEGRVRFIKIDVQGYETAVCHGMHRTVEANPNVAITVEYMPEAMKSLGFEPCALLDWFRAYGFSIHRLMRDGSLQPGMFEPLDERGYLDLLCLRVS
jgi:FkbM family methyltransferase